MNFDVARTQMLSQQIRAWNVLDDRVLSVLAKTARESFVPENDRDLAFADVEIPIGHGQSMMTPKIEARLLQELRIEPLDEILEIGTGSGYLTACLAQLARNVHSVEIFPDLSESAADKLKAARIGNISLEVVDAFELSGNKTYDAIAVTGSTPVLPESFIRLLRPNGRMFIVVGHAPAMNAELVVLNNDSTLSRTSLFETVLEPLVNAPSPEPFVL